jgi:hypothetical protein
MPHYVHFYSHLIFCLECGASTYHIIDTPLEVLPATFPLLEVLPATHTHTHIHDTRLDEDRGSRLDQDRGSDEQLDPPATPRRDYMKWCVAHVSGRMKLLTWTTDLDHVMFV